MYDPADYCEKQSHRCRKVKEERIYGMSRQEYLLLDNRVLRCSQCEFSDFVHLKCFVVARSEGRMSGQVKWSAGCRHRFESQLSEFVRDVLIVH